MSHLSVDNETKDFEDTYCPTLNLELFEGIEDGTILSNKRRRNSYSFKSVPIYEHKRGGEELYEEKLFATLPLHM